MRIVAPLRLARVAAALALAGCAAPQPSYTSPTYTPQSFAADKLDCLQKSRSVVVVGNIGGTTYDDDLFQTCMEAHGYRRTQ